MRDVIQLFMDWRCNISKTIIINFKLFSFIDALKFPIICYGPVYFNVCKGGVKIQTIRRGVVKIGKDFTGYRRRGTTCIKLLSNSSWFVTGTVKIGQGASVLVSENAALTTGHGVTIGDGAEIVCKKEVVIGEHSEVTWDCQVEDYASHPIENLLNNKIRNLYRPVIIGAYCWIGNRTTIQPGTVLPDRVIVASNSLLNKNYIDQGIKSNTLIGGQPARQLRENVRRDYEHDRFIRKWFLEHPDVEEVALEEMLSHNFERS